MKSLFHKIFSIAMALLLLASTVSWTIGMHYCGKALVDVAFFDHAQKCGMGGSTDTSSFSAEVSKMSCCADELAVIVGQDELTTSQVDGALVSQLFFIGTKISYTLVELSDERITSDDRYLPPLLVRDVQLLDQVFLI